MTISSHKKIAIFYTDHDNEWTSPHGNYVEMAKNLLNETKEHPADIEYQVFHVFKGEFPTLSELSAVDEDGERTYIGIFITGSRYDSFDESTEWIVKFRGLLNDLLNNEGYPPLVGICFGHQVIAKTLGCKVGRNPKGFEGGVVAIELNEVGNELFGTNFLHLSELHYDAVFDVPEGYSCWGSTEKCAVQGLYKKNKVLTFQGHPEFIKEVAAKSVEQSRKHHAANPDPERKTLSGEEFDQMLATTELLANDGRLASKKIWKLFGQRL